MTSTERTRLPANRTVPAAPAVPVAKRRWLLSLHWWMVLVVWPLFCAFVVFPVAGVYLGVAAENIPNLTFPGLVVGEIAGVLFRPRKARCACATKTRAADPSWRRGGR